jgi:hypothetical protein
MPDIIVMPDTLYVFAEFSFNLVTVNTVVSGSQFNNQTRVDAPSYDFWQAALTFAPRKDEDLDELIRFVMQQRGGRNLARIYDRNRASLWGNTQPRGAGGATTTVNVADDAAAGAETISIKNLIASQSVALKSVDHIEVGGNLYAIVNSGPSDSGGEGAFSIIPALRKAVAVDDPISLVKPRARMRMTGGAGDLVTNGRKQISNPVTLTFVEDPDFNA